MNKKQFLERLDKELKKITKNEREQVLEFYSNYIDEALNDQNTEENVIEKMGDIKQIVSKIKSEYHVHKLDEEPHIINLLKAIISIFRRVSLLDSVRASISVVLKLLLISTISLFLLVSGIAAALFGATTSLVFLYSSIIVQNISIGHTNIVLSAILLFILLLIVPVIICIILGIVYGAIKFAHMLIKKRKSILETILIVFDWCIIIPGILLICSKIIEGIGLIPPPSLMFLEAVSITVVGITGLIITLLILISNYMNKKVAKSFNKLLIKLEGESVK